jgi:TPP-dependent pyruvate/acetoin dehydrogenase alpha subunit
MSNRDITAADPPTATPQASALLHAMLRIRRVEEALADRYADQEMRCPMHLCIGQEAIAVGVCSLLKTTDIVFGNHRAHGHYLAKGGCLNAMVAELYGRKDGCCGGRGGSMHLIDLAAGFMGATPIVGGTVPLAVGAAWAASLKSTNQVSIVFFGDGCFEEGIVHESLNFAALHKLPVVFVCENNNFSVYTRLEERQPDRPIFRIAEAHGITASSGNGNDVREVLRIAHPAIAAARCGAGPQFLEFSTYRWREHCGANFDDDLAYRSPKEIATGRGNCPIERFLTQEFGEKSSKHLFLAEIEQQISEEISRAFDFAVSSEIPSANTFSEKLYA